jgi:O-antigen/teichoic acid export membrane protein
VWVIASIIVTSQGLFDLGAAQTAARYIAVGSSAGESENVRRVILLSASVYAVLSLFALLIVVPLSGPISGLLGVPLAGRHDAQILLCAGALAFGISNASALLIGILTGFNRAHAAYNAVAAGYVPYLGSFAVGSVTGHPLWGVAASGPVLFTAQCALMIPHARSGIRGLPRRMRESSIRVRELLGYSISMQSASIADFMAPNLPRILAGVMFGAAAVVPLDLTLRVGSLMAGLIAMTQPAVMPALANAWARGDRGGYLRLVRELFGVLCFAAAVLMLVSIACGGAAIRLWVGPRYGDIEGIALAVTAALLVHGVTAPLTSAAQARGDLRRLVAFKLGVVASLVVLLLAMSGWGVTGLGVALALGMSIPSIVYCVGELRGPLQSSGPLMTRLADLMPFLIATGFAVAFRLVTRPSGVVLLAVSTALLAGALAWALYRLPMPIRLLIGRPMSAKA